MREPKDIKIGNYTLEEILERHKHWLNRDCENWESMRADLHDADLHDANMSYANMRGANMKGANMKGANMHGADISYVNIRYTNLHDVNMSYANMHDADMSGTNMNGVDMSYANMRGVDMRGANMRGVDMCGADISYANMHGAYMRGTNMRNANMRYADISYANMRGVDMSGTNMNGVNMSYANMRGIDRLRKGIKLSEPIIGWKKCKNDVLVKLEIPRGAIVFSINNNKCRTDKAKVLEIIGADRAYSNHKFFSYYVGDIIEVFNFNCEYNVECAEGIHFFKTREEAENY